VRGQSNRAIAGSPRNNRQVSATGDNKEGKAPTGKEGGKPLTFLLNSESPYVEEGGSWVFRVSRETYTVKTVRMVKGPKCRLSVAKGGSLLRQLGGRLRSSQPLSNA
jgi:hypothetical protein